MRIFNFISPQDILQTINNKYQQGLSAHLNIIFNEIGEDYLVATMPVDERTKQPFGILHGGASCALAETVGSMASALLIEDLEKERAVGLEINANHLKAVRDGLVKAVAKPIHIGKKTHVWDIKIYNDKGELCCVSRLTTMVVALNSK